MTIQTPTELGRPTAPPAPGTPAVRLMLADDHRMLREGLRRSMTEQGFSVVGVFWGAFTQKEPKVYVDNMQRLLRKFETAKDLVPRPLTANAGKPTKFGVIYYGSTAPAMDEAIDILETKGHHIDRMRVRAFPFHSSVTSFIADHDFVFVVEQNRDAQLRSLIVNECGIDPVRLVPILHYDGTPITARFIDGAIGGHLDKLKIVPKRKVAS